MPSIYHSNMPEATYGAAGYFNSTYQESWLEDELAQRVIKSADKSTAPGSGPVGSKALGLIAGIFPESNMQ